MATELLHNLFDCHPRMLKAFEEKEVLLPVCITFHIIKDNNLFFHQVNKGNYLDKP